MEVGIGITTPVDQLYGQNKLISQATIKNL